MEVSLKRTSLYESHLALNAKMIGFGGWDMPVEYAGLRMEHEAVRNRVGMFDVSHMGEIRITGIDAELFVNEIFTNDVAKMEVHQVFYGLMCYEHGGVVDDLLVYKYTNDHFLLVVNASNIEKDYAWILNQSKNYDVTIVNESEITSEIAVQGPLAEQTLQTLTSFDLSTLKFFYFDEINIQEHNVLISRTGYTGEDGFEIYGTHEVIQSLFEALIQLNVEPCGLGCRDTLRFEANLPLYGHEIDQDITPLEAGLGMFVKLDKPSFIGKDALVLQKESGLTKKVVGFTLVDKGIPRSEYEVYHEDQCIGHVTTGYISPTLNEAIGLALIDTRFSEIGTPIEIQIRKNRVKALVRDRRFYTKKYKK